MHRNRPTVRTAVQCVLLLVVAGACTSGRDQGAPAGSPSASVLVQRFPGGGAILFSDASGVRAAFPDGSTKTIARHFLGAEPFPGLQFFPSGQLLTWKLTHENADYYVMRMEETGYRHVLRPTKRRIPFGVQVSPDGTKLAYIRDTYRGPGRARYDLLVLDLSTDRTVNLGRITPTGPAGAFTYAFAWNNDSTVLLIQSDDRRSIDWINLQSHTRGRYLSVTDRRIIAAYAKVHPGSGPPTEIRPIGWTQNPRFTGFAILASRGDGSNAAVVVLKNGPTRVFAIPRNATGVEFTWAMTGTRFLLASWVDKRHGPTNWVLSVGNARAGQLVEIAKEPRIRSALLDPQGDVVVYAPDPRHWVFTRVGGCPDLQACAESSLQMEGFPLAWVA